MDNFLNKVNVCLSSFYELHTIDYDIALNENALTITGTANTFYQKQLITTALKCVIPKNIKLKNKVKVVRR